MPFKCNVIPAKRAKSYNSLINIQEKLSWRAGPEDIKAWKCLKVEQDLIEPSEQQSLSHWSHQRTSRVWEHKASISHFLKMSGCFSNAVQETEQQLALITINANCFPVIKQPANRFPQQILFTSPVMTTGEFFSFGWLSIFRSLDVIRKEVQSVLLPYLGLEKWILHV